MEKNGFCDEGCGTLTFSGESAAEYAANSGLLRKRRKALLPSRFR